MSPLCKSGVRFRWVKVTQSRGRGSAAGRGPTAHTRHDPAPPRCRFIFVKRRGAAAGATAIPALDSKETRIYRVMAQATRPDQQSMEYTGLQGAREGRPGVRRQALAGLDTAGTCTRMDMVLLRLYVYKKCHASACALACSPSGTITRTPTPTLPRRLGRPPARTGPHPGRRYHSRLRRSPSTVASFQRNTYRPPPP